MSSKTIVQGIKQQAAATYQWKAGSHIHGLDPTAAMAEFQAIYNTNGAVTPELVVRRAEPEGNHLHPHFDWDDAHAAAEYREIQARELLRAVVVVPLREDGSRMEPVRALVKISPTADDADALVQRVGHDRAYEPNVYIPINTAMSEEDYRTAHLRRAWREFLALRNRYRALAEFAELFQAIDALKARIG